LPSQSAREIFLAISEPGKWFVNKESSAMKLSARNQLAGTIVAVAKGQTTAHVRVDIGGGNIVTASITNEAVDDLGLVVGDKVTAVIKSSDVMIGK
jgi:molybdopterin-binding protein